MIMAGPALGLLAGCASNKACDSNTEYLQARERPPLQMPEGVPGSERIGSATLVIPAVAPVPDKLDPAPRCLDEPPGYFKRVTGPAPAPAPAPAAAPASVPPPPSEATKKQ